MRKNWLTRYLSTQPANITRQIGRCAILPRVLPAMPLIVTLFLSVQLSACAATFEENSAQTVNLAESSAENAHQTNESKDNTKTVNEATESNQSKDEQSESSSSEQQEKKSNQIDDETSADTLPNAEQSEVQQAIADSDLENIDSVLGEAILTQQAEANATVSQNDDSLTSQNQPSDSEQHSLNANERNRIQDSLNQNPWLFLHAYNATYEITADGDKLGKATRNMSQENGAWKLEISTKLKKWFLTLKSQEISQFEINNEQLLTKQFYSSTKLSFKKDRIVQQDFDWENKMETGSGGKSDWSLPLDEPVFDRMNHMLKLRADLLRNKEEFSYLISYKGKRKYYSYSRAESEKLSTSFGEFETVKMVRTNGDDSNFTVWLSPELNYFPIKIAQFEQDKPDVVLTLTDLEFRESVNIADK